MTLIHPSPVPVLLSERLIDDMPWEPLPGSPGVRVKQICTNASWATGLLQLTPGAHEATHVHTDSEHHLWVLAGSAQYEDTHLGVGSYLHVPAGLRHSFVDEGNGCTMFYVCSTPSE
ncbi:MAG: cupin domain-containing protein [Frankiaceae bacterium]|nr:cupin domain-containing protein [Frankiaceae bacterium]